MVRPDGRAFVGSLTTQSFADAEPSSNRPGEEAPETLAPGYYPHPPVPTALTDETKDLAAG